VLATAESMLEVRLPDDRVVELPIFPIAGGIFARQETMSQRCIRPLRERAAPILEVLAAHFPNLSEEASVAFAVQIVLANERGDDRNSLLHHLFGSRSSN
jgi:hypothetical protein